MTDPMCDGWVRCPRGTFVRLTSDLAARRVRHMWLTGLGVTLGVVLTAVAGWGAVSAFDDWQNGRWSGRPVNRCIESPPPTPTSACQPAPCP
jgi:hypothetical protein